MPSRRGKLTVKMHEKLRDHEKRYGKQHVRDMKRFLRQNFTFKQAHKLALELNRNVSQTQNVKQVVKVQVGDTKKRRRPSGKKRVIHQHSVSVAPSPPTQAYQYLGQIQQQAVARDNQRRLNVMREQQLQAELSRANQQANATPTRQNIATRTQATPAVPVQRVVNPDNARRGDEPQRQPQIIPRQPLPAQNPRDFMVDLTSRDASSDMFYDMDTNEQYDMPRRGNVRMETLDDDEGSQQGIELMALTARQIPSQIPYEPSSLALPAGEYSPVNVGALPPIQNPQLWRRLGMGDTLEGQIMANIPQRERNPARTFYGLPPRGGARIGAGRQPLVPFGGRIYRDDGDDFLAGSGVTARDTRAKSI